VIPFQNSKRKKGALVDFLQDHFIVIQAGVISWMIAGQYYHKGQFFSSIMAIFHV
jgi:hypothetical protein